MVESVAPSAAALTAARPVAVPTRWTRLGCDDQAMWGACHGGGSEPYDTVVDHVGVGFRCTCPSRRTPCKHAIALLLLWVAGQVPDGVRTASLDDWIERRRARTRDGSSPRSETSDRGATPEVTEDDARAGAHEPTDAGGTGSEAGERGRGAPDDGAGDPPGPPPDRDRDTARNERVERMLAGLTELDRWLDDRLRTGLGDPALARYATWDQLAARLVDAQAGSLANRVRRLAGLVGASPDWHDDVLAELGVLHLLASAARRVPELPGPLADGVATAVGWQVRKADVLAGVPETDHWIVAGRSDIREDRIEVRRHWLRGAESGRWAVLLSFAAYQQSLDTSLDVGTAVHADLHRYPGGSLRALLGARHSLPEPAAPPALSVAAACDALGRLMVDEPWIDRVPVTMRAAPTRVHDRWLLTDATGSVPILVAELRDDVDPGIAMLLAVSAGAPVDLTVEWTPHGVVPLAVHLADRTVDIGPRADESFVGAA